MSAPVLPPDVPDSGQPAFQPLPPTGPYPGGPLQGGANQRRPYAGAPDPGPPFPGPQYPGPAQPGAQYPGGPNPGNPYQGPPYQGPQYPGPQGGHPAGPYPGRPHLGAYVPPPPDRFQALKILGGFALGILFMVLPFWAIFALRGANQFAAANWVGVVLSLIEITASVALTAYRPTRMVAVGILISLSLSPIIGAGACLGLLG